MLTPKTWLLIALAGFTAFYLIVWLSAILKARRTETAAATPAPTPGGLATGFATNFLDTLGIGSFATTTSIFKALRMVRDELIPGTLNVGHTLPTIAQALIYITIVQVEMKTLVALIIAACLGMWLGAGLVSRLPRRVIQMGMGIALLVAAALTLMTIFNKSAGGGTAMGLEGARFWVGVIGNFTLGALMSLGIGLYGPCLIMISLLGMNPAAAFPIMMGSCAFLMSSGSAQYIRKCSYDLRAALGLGLGGVPAVLIAAFIVKSLPLYWVRWLVVVVVVYTALMLLRAAVTEKAALTSQQNSAAA